MVQKHWQGNIAELSRLLSLMGLSVVAVPGAGSGVAALRESTTASCNIVVFPEYAQKTAAFYEHGFGIPAIVSLAGAPVGFTATEAWIRTVAGATGRDPSPALEEIRTQRTRAYHQIARHHHEAGYPKGASFAIRGDSSFVLPLTSWLHEYLGMIPVFVSCMAGADGSMVARLDEFLAANGLSGAAGTGCAEVEPDFWFGDDLTGTDLVLSGRCRETVGLFNRATGGPEFVEKAFLGGTGALWLLEHIFHAVTRFPE
jgi:nitrogenase molybdenum-iron protein alpha/beta subunit